MSAPIPVVRTLRFDRATPSNPSKQTTTVEFYSDPAGVFKSGFWSSKVGKYDVRYEKDELCTLLEGKVRLIDKDGHAEEYRAGDTFLVPNDFEGSWDVIEPTKKFYAIYNPAAGLLSKAVNG